MINDRNNIDDLFDSIVDELCDNDINKGADSLVELAHFWAKAGFTKKSFLEMRLHLIQKAEERTDVYFIREKLKLAEMKNHDRRQIHGNRIIIT